MLAEARPDLNISRRVVVVPVGLGEGRGTIMHAYHARMHACVHAYHERRCSCRTR